MTKILNPKYPSRLSAAARLTPETKTISKYRLNIEDEVSFTTEPELVISLLGIKYTWNPAFMNLGGFLRVGLGFVNKFKAGPADADDIVMP